MSEMPTPQGAAEGGRMLWIWLPIVVLIVAVCLWIAISAVRRRGGSGVREGGRVVYDENAQKKSPDAPPA